MTDICISLYLLVTKDFNKLTGKVAIPSLPKSQPHPDINLAPQNTRRQKIKKIFTYCINITYKNKTVNHLKTTRGGGGDNCRSAFQWLSVH